MSAAFTYECRDEVIEAALDMAAADVTRGELLSASPPVKAYLRLKLAGSEREVFGCLLLDARNRLIEDRALFWGSVDRTAVYPREVIKAALRANACGAILYHNHPSGVAEPSPSDVQLTCRIHGLLEELDVRLVDHIVASGAEAVSMAERGLI